MVDEIVAEVINNLDYNYLITIPLLDYAFQKRLAAFHEQVLENDKIRESEGWADELLMPQEKFHFTLAVLKIYTEAEVKKAREVFANIGVYDALNTQSVVFDLNGLESWDKDTSQLDVVYTVAKSGEDVTRLTKVAMMIRDAMWQAGFVLDDRPLALHATVLNTKYRSKGESNEDTKGKKKKKWSKRIHLDATELFLEFGTFDFGKGRIGSIEFGMMGELDQRGFYKQLEVLNLP
eukprot:TRINITY_DN3349_c0_g1_i1.p1 TRINITY_DN3349_c0_g1~~TRINITY_DN3349_c0_g1_i1.p1  ORF type:complete len:235 (-),score=100.25 TRINITY_DN3349_c0_g1_i1:32-736(-)